MKVNALGYFLKRVGGRISALADTAKNISYLCVLNLRWSMHKLIRVELTSDIDDFPVIVSLTSYEPRFKTLHRTIKSLQMQSYNNYKIILWVSYEDLNVVPRSVTAMVGARFEIRSCEDLKSYKKIIPSLDAFPSSIIVTADDDVYYWGTWLAELVDHHSNNTSYILSHRIHRIKVDNQGRIAPYQDWLFAVDDDVIDAKNFATGLGGVLYPPGSLYGDVTDKEKFLKLAAHGDDVWLYWMARINNFTVKKVKSTRKIWVWTDSQGAALWRGNVFESGNDRIVAAMLNHYGMPF